MKNTFLSSVVALFVFAGTASAAELSGTVGVEVTENAAGNYVAATTLGFGVTADTDLGLAFGGFNFESVDGGDLTVDEWQVGITTPLGTLSFGDQGDLFVGNDFEVVGGDTLANPASDHESLIAEFGSAAVLIGFTDITADISDVENIQGSYSLALNDVTDVTVVADYNLNSEEYALGLAAGYAVTADISVGGIVTYDSALEAIGYEANASYKFATVFVNGDDTDALQNVGAGVSYGFDNLNMYAEAAYNVDSEEFTPALGVSFSF
jgi:hypothetical protein